jgi:hypothetical protein
MIAGQVRMAYQKKYWVKVYVEEQVNLSKRYKDIIYKQHREIYDTYVRQFQELRKLKQVRVEHLPLQPLPYLAWSTGATAGSKKIARSLSKK